MLPTPQLPLPLTLGFPSLPTLPTIGLTLCCKITILPPDLPYPLNGQPILPPLVLALPIQPLLNAAVSTVNSYLQDLLALIPPCPKNTTIQT